MALLNPYLNFRGQAREAMEFYRSALGGELTVSTFGDFQMPGVEEDEKDSIMHSQLTTSAGFTLMGSDVWGNAWGNTTPGAGGLSLVCEIESDLFVPLFKQINESRATIDDLPEIVPRHDDQDRSVAVICLADSVRRTGNRTRSRPSESFASHEDARAAPCVSHLGGEVPDVRGTNRAIRVLALH